MEKEELTYLASVDNIIQYRQWLVYRIQLAEKMNLKELADRKTSLQRFDEIFVLGTKKVYGIWGTNY